MERPLFSLLRANKSIFALVIVVLYSRSKKYHTHRCQPVCMHIANRCFDAVRKCTVDARRPFYGICLAYNIAS